VCRPAFIRELPNEFRGRDLAVDAEPEFIAADYGSIISCTGVIKGVVVNICRRETIQDAVEILYDIIRPLNYAANRTVLF
jgi:hypothetical protein